RTGRTCLEVSEWKEQMEKKGFITDVCFYDEDKCDRRAETRAELKSSKFFTVTFAQQKAKMKPTWRCTKKKKRRFQTIEVTE
ncbi:hypothetical protein RUM43_003161, partial [Polyplax serrata]